LLSVLALGPDASRGRCADQYECSAFVPDTGASSTGAWCAGTPRLERDSLKWMPVQAAVTL